MGMDDNTKERKFTGEETDSMYQILYEIHSGLSDKEMYSGMKLSCAELAWKISIERLFSEMENSRKEKL